MAVVVVCEESYFPMWCLGLLAKVGFATSLCRPVVDNGHFGTPLFLAGKAFGEGCITLCTGRSLERYPSIGIRLAYALRIRRY